MTIYSNLSLKSLDDVERYVIPEEYEVTLDSPAKLVLTDFNKIEPQVIYDDLSISKATQIMQNTHFWMKLVLDRETDKFLGILLLRDLFSRRVMTKTTELGVSRDELVVKHLMRPKTELFALCKYQLKQATVGDIIHTLKEHGEQYCLVLDSEENNIQGIISANEIRKKLGTHYINIEEKPHSFMEIFTYLHRKI